MGFPHGSVAAEMNPWPLLAFPITTGTVLEVRQQPNHVSQPELKGIFLFFKTEFKCGILYCPEYRGDHSAAVTKLSAFRSTGVIKERQVSERRWELGASLPFEPLKTSL